MCRNKSDTNDEPKKILKFCPVLISTALSGEIWIHSIELGINGDESNILKMDQHIGVDSDDQMPASSWKRHVL